MIGAAVLGQMPWEVALAHKADVLEVSCGTSVRACVGKCKDDILRRAKLAYDDMFRQQPVQWLCACCPRGSSPRMLLVAVYTLI